MNLFPFQIEAANRIAERFQTYNQNPLLVTRTEILPFYQNLSSITGSGKTLILVETVVNLRAMLPLEPIVLWISKGKVVVEQTLHNLSNGKYAASLGNFIVKPLLEATKDEIEDTSKGLMLIATVAKFNQKDRDEGDRRIFRAELDVSEKSLWDTLKNRWNGKNQKRPLVIVYDEGHNLSNQQTKLLMELQPDAILAASATIKVPTELGFAVERLRVEKKWTDEDFFVRVKSSEAVDSGLIKQNIQLGGYLTPMEVAVSEMHEDMKLVANAAQAENLNFSPKAIYVTSTNVVEHAVVEDSNTTPFFERKARPIVIWRYLVEELGVDPQDIAVYCNLKFGKTNQPPTNFNLFAGGDSDYQRFTAGSFKHIIFNLSLQEGWDDPACYFAYIDKEMGSKIQITQVIGRVLRQPDARHHADNRLNTAHFYIRTDEKNVFDEVIQDVRANIISENPAITLNTYKSGDTKEPKPKLAPKKKFLVPKIDKDSEAAYPFIKRIVDSIPDFRADSVNTVGNGEKQVVRQRVGSDQHAPDIWVEVPHSNLVNARFVFNREIQKHYAAAAEPCEMHEAKFDAKIEYNSRAADLLRQSAIDVVDTFLEHSEIVQSYAEPDEVPEMAVDPVNCEKYKNAIHESYSGFNELEKEFATALDAAGNAWCRNPSRGFFEIPLLDKGRTKNFNPDFLVWSGKTAIFAIDTKGDHLIKEDSARKLFHVKKLGKGPHVFVRLVTKGEWNNQVQKIGSSGYTVWVLRNGTIHPIKAQNVEDAVQICLRES
jgi:type III restriction enzyme